MSVKLHLMFRKDGSAPALIAALLYVTLEDGWVYDHIVVIFQAGILYRHCERLDVGRCTEAANNNVPSLITVTPLRIEAELSEPTSFTKSQLLLSLTMLADSVLSPPLSPPWPSGLKRWNQTLVPVVRARFEPRCGLPHFAPTRSGVRICGRNRTEAREREWAEGTVSSLPGTLNVRIKFCHSTGIARSGGGVRASTTSYA